MLSLGDGLLILISLPSRLLPRLLPRLRAGDEGRSRFSPELYRKHREYNALLGTLAVIAALALRLWMTR